MSNQMITKEDYNTQMTLFPETEEKSLSQEFVGDFFPTDFIGYIWL
ncbi:hypothetical protein [Anoxybacillus ayderensis]|nr:hypothetical protein [Anoxybacillus ayderensis]